MKGRHSRWLWAVLVMAFTTALGAWASQQGETTITVQVSSADHELMEGYFTLGENLTLMAKPGTEIHRFLARHRGRKVKISLTDAAAPAGPARLER